MPAAAVADPDVMRPWYAASTSGAYQYPLTPEGNPAAWRAAAADTASIVTRLRVPERRLRSMTTAEVLETVFSYPFLVNYWLFDTPQQGIEALVRECAALQEFLRRGDGAQVLLELYESTDLQDVAASEGLDATIQVAFIELLLAQPAILNSLGRDGRGAMADAVTERWVEKQTVFSSDFYGEGMSALAVMRALELDSAEFAGMAAASSDVTEFLSTGLSITLTETSWQATEPVVRSELGSVYAVDVDALMAADMVQSVSPIVQDAGPVSIQSISYLGTNVYTPKGSAVRALNVIGDLSQAERDAIDRSVRDAYPGVTISRASTAKYNCHSYAFYGQSSGNGVWINDPALYMSDGSYSLVASKTYTNTIPTVAANGSKVSYVSGGHSAIKYSSTQFISKWGQGPLVIHKPTSTPYSSTTGLKYYRLA